jgi:hypothetical protein
VGLLRRVRRNDVGPPDNADQALPQLRVWRGNGGSADWFWRITAPGGRWLANDSARARDEAMEKGLAALRAAAPPLADH